MKLHIEAGHSVTGDVKQIEGQAVRFVTENGRTMFEVAAHSDGRGIEVRGVEMTKHGDTFYTSALTIAPIASNCIGVRTQEYGTK
jgi:hypothetical protein